MIEQIVIGIVFLAAIAYLVQVARKSFSSKEAGCAKGCGTCSAADIKKIEATIIKEKAAK